MDATHRESVHALALQINHIATPVQDAGSQLSWWDGRAAALYAGSNLNETLADSPTLSRSAGLFFPLRRRRALYLWKTKIIQCCTTGWSSERQRRRP